jgi:hypothetical protein
MEEHASASLSESGFTSWSEYGWKVETIISPFHVNGAMSEMLAILFKREREREMLTTLLEAIRQCNLDGAFLPARS